MVNTLNSFGRFTVHTRSRYGVYRLAGVTTKNSEAYRLMADEVTKGVAAQVWIREEDEKIYEWDHEHDTQADAQWWAEVYGDGIS